MQSHLGSWRDAGLPLLRICAAGWMAGCASPPDSSTSAAPDTELLGPVTDKQDICLADPPVDVPTRTVFQINELLTAFYDGRNTLRLSPDPNWVDDAAKKLGVATYAIHQGSEAIVFDTFPTTDQARWQRSTLEAMGITHFTIVT